MRQLLPAFLLLTFGFAECRATTITYDVEQTISSGGVIGFIETDGTIGPLAASNIVNWNLLVNNGMGAFDLLGPLSGNNSVAIVDSGLSATTTTLSFDFTTFGDALEFSSNPSGAALCLHALVCGASSGGAETVWVDGASNFQYITMSGTQAIAGTQATASGAPEPTTLVLFGAGIAFLAFHKRRQ